MFYIKSNDDLTNHIVSLDTIQTHVKDFKSINKNIKLLLIFSLKKCNPCNTLTTIIDELFSNALENEMSIPIQIIKFEYHLLNEHDKNLLEGFPLTIVYLPEQLKKIDVNESLLKYGLENCKTYQGKIEQLCSDHNLIMF
jgi:hypothetical protein